MSKKITSLFLVLVMMLSMMITAIPAVAAETSTGTLIITADRTNASAGDTIQYTVTLGPITDLDGVQFKMAIPDGLTYVPESGKIPEGLEETLGGNSKAAFNEEKQIMIIGTIGGYTSTVNTVLCTFSCTVDEGFGGSAVMDFDYEDSFVFINTKDEDIEMTITTATVIVEVVCDHKNVTTYAANEATCEENGNVEYYICNDCNTLLVKENGKYVVTTEDKVVIPALGHDYNAVNEVPATCEEDGVKAHYVCERCGKLFDSEKVEITEEELVITAAGHDYALVEEIDATCGKDGVAAHYVCERCGKLFNSDKEEITKDELVITATGEHTYSEEWSKNSTYHWHECTVCGAVKEDPKEAHIYEDGKCTECGYIEPVDPSAPIVVFYTITAEASEGGSITPEGNTSVSAYTDKTYTIKADDGYVIIDVLVDGKSIGVVDSYTFNDVSADHKISVVFKWINPFIDVVESDRYYNAIKYVYQNNLFIGTSDTEFSPNMTMDRSMFATVLCRLAGVTPAEVTKSSFSDAVDGAWYVPYIEWAASEGLMLGYGDGKFGVADQITIEQAAIIMTRFAEYTGMDVSSDFAFDSYSDADSISEWAVEQMKWVVENGIYVGEGNKLNPTDLAKRCQVADIINLYAEKFVK
ncbi:MAG: S-layer homology domain-containing protein [Eubacteriales bacterium]